MSDEQPDRGKKIYEPPKLSIISLRPEEAVLGHGKNSVVSGPGGMGTCSPVGPCNSIGS
jgi:hypothetical protein